MSEILRPRVQCTELHIGDENADVKYSTLKKYLASNEFKDYEPLKLFELEIGIPGIHTYRLINEAHLRITIKNSTYAENMDLLRIQTEDNHTLALLCSKKPLSDTDSFIKAFISKVNGNFMELGREPISC